MKPRDSLAPPQRPSSPDSSASRTRAPAAAHRAGLGREDAGRPSAEQPPASAGDGVEPDLLDYLFDEPAANAVRLPSVEVGQRLSDALVESRLAGMGDASVRAVLARKLCRLLPQLPPDGQDKVTAVALRALEQLARDHVGRVREALATAIQDIACAPPSVVRRLAHDVERSVAEPILHCCATLTDEDLLAIIASQPADWALIAIADRRTVSPPVSDAIVEADRPEASGILIDNSGAAIPDDTLARLVEQATTRRDFQGKLARRPGLPRPLAVRMAAFVDESVVEVLRSRPDFDSATVSEIASAMRRRIDWVEAHHPAEPPERRAIRLHRQGALDETALGDALSWNETEFVRAALALRAAVRPALVDAILASHDARAVTALVWRAGLSMRCAMQVQARAAAIPARAMLNARDGTAYPMTPADMVRQLARYGIPG